ncbi:hypothetical protein BGZ65_004895, partial [Modicella reniformis]
TWKEEKAKTPFGFLPILTVRGPEEEGSQILQNFAEADVIERYLAKELGFFGSTPEEELQISIFYSQAITIHNVWIFRVIPALAPVRAEILKAFKEITLKRWIDVCERYLVENGNNGHFFGNKVTLADVKVAVLLDMFLAVDTNSEYLNADKSPGLLKLKEIIDTHPKYSEFRRSEAFRLKDQMTEKMVVPWMKEMGAIDMTRTHLFA